MCVAPSSGHSWMLVVQEPASPSAPPSLVTVLPSMGETPASPGGVTVAIPDVWLPLQPARMARALATAAGHRAVDLTLALSLLGVFTFVPALLAVNQGQLGLHAPLLFIQRQGHQRAPFFTDLVGETVDFSPVQQELALAPRVV